MTPELIDIKIIEVASTRRPVNAEYVDNLASSIQEIGLMTPVTLLDVDEGTTLRLVAGRHRIEAFRKLGRDKIEAFVMEGSALDAEMWEIAENLHRAELTALERDEQIARWLELAEARTFATCENSKPGPKGAKNTAAKEIGIGKDAAYRAAKVASLSDRAKEVARQTGLDANRSALLDAAKHKTPEGQVTSLQRRFAQRTAADPVSDLQAKENQVRGLMAAWNRAGSDARQEFLLRIDETG